MCITIIIDIHSHLGTSWNAWWQNEVTEESFIANMDRWGIDKACVSYWGIAHDPNRGNKLVSDFAANYPDRIIGFACIVPTWWKDAVREVEIARICAPVYFKFEPGKSESELYNAWKDPSYQDFLVREKVKYAQICKEWCDKSDYNLVFNSSKDDLSIPQV